MQTTGLFERQDALYPPVALGTSCPQRAFAPLDPKAQGALGVVVGRLDAVLCQKYPSKALSAADQFIHSMVSSVRVVVEHVMAGVKRCRIVKDVLRLTQDGVSNLVMEMVCGLQSPCALPSSTASCRYTGVV